MSTVTPQQIKNLRERTGVGVAKCKEALVESEGDIERAVEFLRKTGVASAVKKATRVTHEGRIELFENDEAITLLEMNAETDFVVKNELFGKFQKEIIEEAALTKPSSLAEFLEAKRRSDPSKSVDETRKELISVLGENINISRVLYIAKKPNSSLGVYSHMNGRILTLVEIEGAADESDFAREIAMHIAAEAPDYLMPEDVPAELKAKEEEIARSQLPEGKPEQVLEKILAGKMRAFYDQVCLLNQKYIKDNAISIKELVEKRSKESSKKLKITKFVRWYIGGE